MSRSSKPDPRKSLGAEGEARAARFLAARGYRIVARNVRAGGVEIDIVARRGSLLVFAEVKTRRSRATGAPEEAVDARKQLRLVRGARAWLFEQHARATRVRFDVLVCEPRPEDPSRWQVRHLPGAFDAS